MQAALEHAHAVFAAVAQASDSSSPVALDSGPSGPVALASGSAGNSAGPTGSALGIAAAVITKSKDAAPSTSGPEKPTRQKFDQAVLGRRMSAAMPLRPMMASSRHCTASGRNLETAVVREASMFTIFAHDANGKRRSEGGDEFVVTIRNGGVKVRSKVIDNKNGTYTVQFKFEVSGRYTIRISLYGEDLPCSPALCFVRTPIADAARCVLTGESLYAAVARVQQVLEIQFRDSEGQVAHAEELDVHVVRMEQDAGVQDSPGSVKNTTAHAKDEESFGEPSAMPVRRGGSKSKKGATAAASLQVELEIVQSVQAANVAATPSNERGLASTPPPPPKTVHAVTAVAVRPQQVPRLKTAACIITSKSPLIVRSGLGLDSDRLGELLPGKRVYIHDVQHDASGACRALVAVNDVCDELKGLEATMACWKEHYRAKPAWLEETLETARSSASRHSPGRSPGRSPRSPRRAVGWVTVAKDGRELVALDTALPAGDRQLHIRAWARRLAVDQSVGRASGKGSAGGAIAGLQAKIGTNGDTRKLLSVKDKKGGKFANELAADPKAIGFAYGGVEPGRLHAKGRLIETHRVKYSIGVVGTYELHIGLRHQGMPLPGSPFLLKVSPGLASASSTGLPPRTPCPLLGVVGQAEAQGCHLLIPAFDKMHNACVSGGARFECTCTDVHVACSTIDLGNGTYELMWRSEVSGLFQVSMLIEDEPLAGCPYTLRLVSDDPDMSRTKLLLDKALLFDGRNLVPASKAAKADKVNDTSKADEEVHLLNAGKSTTIALHLFDRFDNVAVGGVGLEFGKTQVGTGSSRNQWRQAASDPFVGSQTESGVDMTFTPERAGYQDLYLWYAINPEGAAAKLLSKHSSTQQNQTAKGGVVRLQLPGSPFRVLVLAGDASSSGSTIYEIYKAVQQTEGQQTLQRKETVSANAIKTAVALRADHPAQPTNAGSRVGAIVPANGTVGAGELVLVRPLIRDVFGNPAAANDDDLPLRITVILPADGPRLELQAQSEVKGGLTSYEAPFEPRVMGHTQISVTIAGREIEGSPFGFRVLAGVPEPKLCKFVMPESPLYATYPYEVRLICYDKFDNKCNAGGSSINGRLQGPNMPPGQDTIVPVTDVGDGTYILHVTLRGPSDVKLNVSVARESPNPNAEFTPLSMSFVSARLKKDVAAGTKDSKATPFKDAASALQPPIVSETYSLTITELEARGLPNTDVEGGADPYVVFHHGDLEFLRTADLRNALDGRVEVVRWPDAYTAHASSWQSSRPTISVTVYDKESADGTDATSTVLGRGTFEIQLVPGANMLEQQISLPLSEVPQGAAASIRLTLSMTHGEGVELSGSENTRLRGAVNELVTGMGLREDRRSRKVAGSAEAALEVAAGAFAKAGKDASSKKRNATAPSS